MFRNQMEEEDHENNEYYGYDVNEQMSEDKMAYFESLLNKYYKNTRS